MYLIDATIHLVKKYATIHLVKKYATIHLRNIQQLIN